MTIPSTQPSLLLVLAGPNGSGKSTFASQVDFSQNPMINPDDIARNINPISSESAAIEAGRQVIALTEGKLSKGESFAFETTLSGNRELKVMERAKTLGYTITLIYVGLDDPQINVQRVSERVAIGGHNVPADVIIRRYEHSMDHLSRAVDLSDQARVYDNSGKSYHLIMEYQRGQMTFLEENLPVWAQKALDSILRKFAADQP